MAPNPGCASQGASASLGDSLSPAAQRWVPGEAPGPGLGGRRAGRGSVAVPEQSSPRFEINPLPARAAPAGAEPPLPPRPLSRPGAPRANPRLCTAAAANQAVGTALRPRLQPDLGKSPRKLFLFFFFPFFLFANTLYPRSKLGGKTWLVQDWLAGTRGLPAIPSLVPRQLVHSPGSAHLPSGP